MTRKEALIIADTLRKVLELPLQDKSRKMVANMFLNEMGRYAEENFWNPISKIKRRSIHA